jgi:hypothetical protein
MEWVLVIGFWSLVLNTFYKVGKDAYVTTSKKPPANVIKFPERIK